MDCRLQISDLEGRLKSLESTKQDLTDSQTQCERLRMTLETNEAKLADAERRADESLKLIKLKDNIIEKQSNFTKEIEERLRNVTEDRDRLLLKSNTLEVELNAALIRGEDADELKEKLKSLEALFDKLSVERSETTTESGLAAANDYFKSEQARSEAKIEKLKDSKCELERIIDSLEQDKKDMQLQMDKQMEEYDKVNEKCSALETRIKEFAQSEKRYGGGMMGSRLIGPTLPPWITDEKKIENDLERLSKADPATLRAKVMELENQLSELSRLLTYREDVILRIHEEISKKASKLEAAEVERSSLTAQVSILKRELATARDDLSRRGVGPADLEAEVERLRGKRDREYQRRKRIEADMDELERENEDLKHRIKRLDEAMSNMPAKPAVPHSDPSDRNRILELQGTVNQLRMDNEAKRSELFDLRSRFDAKSNQLDKISAEMKTKERSTGELTSQLNSVQSQLETVTTELETVRCRAVRGGAEVERWHSDLTSLQVTNKFLSSQLNEVRDRLLFKDRIIADLNRRCSPQAEPEQVKSAIVENGVSDDESVEQMISSPTDEDTRTQTISKLECKLAEVETRLAEVMKEFTENREQTEQYKSKMETDLADAQTRVTLLSTEVVQKQKNMDALTETQQQLTSQLNELEATLTSTRAELLEAKSDNRRSDLEAILATVSPPPTKRTRRSAANSAAKNATNHQDCLSCSELRKQVEDLEHTVSDYSAREATLTAQNNNLRQEILCPSAAHSNATNSNE